MKASQIFLASDHAGFSCKESVLKAISEKYEVKDLGTHSEDRCDYPDFASQVCESINNENQFGLLICGSGQGMAMRANKYTHIRAALCWSAESAQLSRQHNNANVLCLGARLLDENTILSIIDAFFSTDFEGGRHTGRVDKISAPVS